ncbi:zinc-ribbon domain-containing protein [Paenibacillus sp. M1]|uniref:Zinc-ribbon domain-containing protein n=1 Tax=Paenibacillus haidiansis TaxID=1574488 RepID=A0ABU7VWM5_9BACL
MKYCSECGAKLESNVKFCSECGTRIEPKPDVEKNAEAANEPVPVSVPESGQIAEPPSGGQAPEPVADLPVKEQEPEPVSDMMTDPPVSGPTSELPASPETSVPALETASPNPPNGPVSQPVPTMQPAPAQPAATGTKEQGAFLRWIQRHKWPVISVAAAALLVLIGLFFISTLLGGSGQLADKFEKAVEAGDAQVLASMLKPGEQKLVVNKETVRPLLDLLREDELLRAQVVDEIEAQIEMHKKENGARVADVYAESIIQVKKAAKQSFLKADYELVVVPCYANVSTTYPDTKILVNGKEFFTTDEEFSYDEIGPLMPGKATIKAQFDGKYASLAKEETLTLSNPLEYYDVNLDLEGETVYVSSNYDEAAIYIDGEDTGLTTSDYEGIGPILLDGSSKAYVQKEFPWGTVKSEELPIDSEDMQIDIAPENDQFRDSIQTAVQTFYQEFLNALNTQDTSAMTHVSNAAEGEVAPIIQEMKNSNLTYSGKLTKIIFDMDSIEFTGWGDDYRANASIQVHYTQTVTDNADSTNTMTEDIVSNETFQLTYENDQWIVTSIYEDYSFDAGNSEEVLM